MIKSGLVSVTFRKLKPHEIVELVARAGLDGIEWGGDIHVPHGDFKIAKEVVGITVDAGLEVAAYGSYYKVGCEDKNYDSFKKVLETAVILKAPTIRVWAGGKGTDEADASYKETIFEGSRNIAELAKKAGISISFEFHEGSLTDTNENALQFFKELKNDNVKSYWQPNLDIVHKLDGLSKLSPWLSNLHIFHWSRDAENNTLQHPLIVGEKELEPYFNFVGKLQGCHYAMLEFVKNGEPNQFIEDALVLKRLVEAGNM